MKRRRPSIRNSLRGDPVNGFVRSASVTGDLEVVVVVRRTLPGQGLFLSFCGTFLRLASWVFILSSTIIYVD